MSNLNSNKDSDGRMRPSFAELATDAIDLVRAARDLIETEWALSRQSLRGFVAGALVFPILATGL